MDILGILEEYLRSQYKGYTSNDYLEAGMPRSDEQNVLTNAMRWKFGKTDRWITLAVSLEKTYLVKNRKTYPFFVPEDEPYCYELSPLLIRFLSITYKLHTGPDPNIWYGDVRFWEAKRALHQAKREEGIIKQYQHSSFPKGTKVKISKKSPILPDAKTEAVIGEYLTEEKNEETLRYVPVWCNYSVLYIHEQYAKRRKR